MGVDGIDRRESDVPEPDEVAEEPAPLGMELLSDATRIG